MRIIVGMFGGLVIGALSQYFLYELGLVYTKALSCVFFGIWGGCAIAGSVFWYRSYTRAGPDLDRHVDDITLLADCDDELLRRCLKADDDWIARQVLLAIGTGRFVESDGVALRAIRDVSCIVAGEAVSATTTMANGMECGEPIKAVSVTATGRLVFPQERSANRSSGPGFQAIGKPLWRNSPVIATSALLASTPHEREPPASICIPQTEKSHDGHAFRSLVFGRCLIIGSYKSIGGYLW